MVLDSQVFRQATFIEVAVRNHILKLTGLHPAQELTRRLQESMEKPEYIPHTLDPDQGDFE